MNRPEKIIITGASGFLGTHLVRRLKDDKRFLVSALSSRHEELQEKLGGNVRYLYKDALGDSGAADLLHGAIIVNCAYPRNSTGTEMAEGLRYIQRVFECAADHKASAIINISSQSVYSQKRTAAAAENTAACLESPYAVGKYGVELLLESICKGTETRFTSLRMASLIGPEFDQRIVNRLVKQALLSGRITVKNNQQEFGFFDVEDAVSYLVTMLDSDPEKWKPVYNIGKNETYSLAEIAQVIKETIERSSGKSVEIVELSGDEKTNSGLSTVLFQDEFKPPAPHSLQDSVETICRYLTNNDTTDEEEKHE